MRIQPSRRLHHFRFPGHLPGERLEWLHAAKGNPVKKLSSTEAAYIAGLIDGEGTVTLTRKHRNENRQLCVTISSTERQLLEFVEKALSAGKITNKATVSKRHSPSFTYAITNRQALELLKQIQPWLLSDKRQRAAMILKDYVRLTPRNGKYSPATKKERLQFEQTVLGIKARDSLR